MRWDGWGRHLRGGDEEGAIIHQMLGLSGRRRAQGEGGGKQAASRIGIGRNAHEEGTAVRGRG